MKPARRWSVYVARCADGSLYVGIATDVDARLAAHNAGRGARYTRSRLPTSLVWTWRCAHDEDARRLEGLLKRLPHSAKVQITRAAPQVLGPLLIEAWARRSPSQQHGQ